MGDNTLEYFHSLDMWPKLSLGMPDFSTAALITAQGLIKEKYTDASPSLFQSRPKKWMLGERAGARGKI